MAVHAAAAAAGQSLQLGRQVRHRLAHGVGAHPGRLGRAHVLVGIGDPGHGADALQLHGQVAQAISHLRRGAAHAQQLPGQPLAARHLLQLSRQLGGTLRVLQELQAVQAVALSAVAQRGRHERRGHEQRLVLLLHTVGRCVHLKGGVELGVVHLEEALLQGDDGVEAVAPQDLVLRVRRPRLASHACQNSRKLTKKRDKKTTRNTLFVEQLN